MKLRFRELVIATLLPWSPLAPAFAQDAASPQTAVGAASQRSTSVPRLVSFGGVLKDPLGKPVSGPVPVTFSLFAQQEGGTALWSETQTVEPDAMGNYTVFLGATTPPGLPLDLFATTAARWLAVEAGPPAAVEPSRILLVGVPYALKAADADTLGGKPASAFVTTSAQQASPSGETPAVTVGAGAAVTPATTPSGSGTKGYVPLWTSGTTLGNSILFQSGNALQVNGSQTVNGTGPVGSYALTINQPNQSGVLVEAPWTSGGAGVDLAITGALAKRWEISATGYSSSQGVGNLNIHDVNTGKDPFTIQGNDLVKIPNLTVAGSLTANTMTGNPSVSGNITANGYVSGNAGFFSGSGLLAANNNGVGVIASGTAGGVSGESFTNANFSYGMKGWAYGNSAETWGLWGGSSSPNGMGVYGQLVGASTEGVNRFRPAGVWGDSGRAGGTGVFGTADDGWAANFFNNSIDSTVWIQNESSSDAAGTLTLMGVDGNQCDVDDYGDVACSGYINGNQTFAAARVGDTPRQVAVYSVGAPENWFEDFGSGQLSGGAATVALDATFAQTVNTGVEYHVFLTPKGDCKGLYVTNETVQGFEVRELSGGASNVAFDYRIVAKRRGYESIRLADLTKRIESMKRMSQRAEANNPKAANHRIK